MDRHFNDVYLQTLANLVAIGAGITAPFAVWFAAKQTSLAQRQFNRGGGIRVEVRKSGSLITIGDAPTVSPNSVTVYLEGPGERHNFEVSLRVCDEFRVLAVAPSPFTSSSEPISAQFDLTPEDEKSAYLFATWVAESRHGLVPQAVRFALLKDGQSEYWRWSRWRHFWFRKLHHKFPRICDFSLGKWCMTPNRPYSRRNLPTWPLGKPSKKLGELHQMPQELRL